MSKPDSYILIGIDGGGTRCRFAIKTNLGAHEFALQGANVHTDRPAALAILQEGLSILCERAGIRKSALQDAKGYAGLAGIVNRRQAREIEEALPLGAVCVEDDRRSAVVGALGSSVGAVAGIGTGSFVARQTDTDLKILGGYGADLGDEASGCWLGKALLARTLHARDGLAEHSGLIAETWQRFGDDLETLLTFAKQAKPFQLAELAPMVVNAAAAGDPNAKALMSQGADYILQCLAALGRVDGEPLCLLGGLAPHYAPFLPENVGNCIVEAQGSALDGALQLAAKIPERTGAAS